MNCDKCLGLLIRKYDTYFSRFELCCINCGNQPERPSRRADGRPLNEPLYCRKCKERPRMTTRLAQGALAIEIEFCAVCRTEQLCYRRTIDGKRRKRFGNLRAIRKEDFNFT